MRLELTNFEKVTPEKALWVEGQANRMLDFLMESRSQLGAEAHKTLQWLFAIIVGATGYVVTLLKQPPAPGAGQPPHVQWWLIWPLIVAVAVAAVAAVRLFHVGLRAVEVLPAGNEPRKLATDELMACDEHWMRLAETAQLQERIEIAAQHNGRVGDAINAARWVVAVLPFAVLILLAVCYLTLS